MIITIIFEIFVLAFVIQVITGTIDFFKNKKIDKNIKSNFDDITKWFRLQEDINKRTSIEIERLFKLSNKE